MANIQAFEQVIRVLREVEEKNLMFDLDHWFLPSTEIAKLPRDERNHIAEAPCGTHACAIGWCTMDKWFQDRGLRMLVATGAMPVPHFAFKTGTAALKSFFSVGNEIVEAVFMPDGYPQRGVVTAGMVADKHRAACSGRATSPTMATTTSMTSTLPGAEPTSPGKRFAQPYPRR